MRETELIGGPYDGDTVKIGDPVISFKMPGQPGRTADYEYRDGRYHYIEIKKLDERVNDV